MIETLIRNTLIADLSLTALVVQRIYPISLPQNPIYPALAYTRISTFGRELHHAGAAKVAEARFQLSCFGNDPSQAKSVATAARRALHGKTLSGGGEKIFWCQAVNEIDLWDTDLGYQVALDLIVAYVES